MARPEVEPKTQLGKRLRHVRSLLEVADRDAFAEQLGIAKSSLANYERGERVPDASVLNAYKTVFGVNLNWLISGVGDPLDDPALAAFTGSLAKDSAIDRSLAGPDLEVFDATSGAAEQVEDLIAPDLVEHLFDLAGQIYMEVGLRPPPRRLVREAVQLHNEVMSMIGQDVADADMVRTVSALVLLRFRRRLEQAARAPGTGKRSAS